MYFNLDKFIAFLIGFLVAAFLVGSGLDLISSMSFQNLFPFIRFAKDTPGYALAWSCFWAIVILGGIKLFMNRNKY